MQKNFVVKGNIISSKNPSELAIHENAFLVCAEGLTAGIFPELPEEYASFPLYDYGKCLIIPGLVDLHVHAPQYTYRGLGMDKELLDWLQTYAFPEESRYEDPDYAERAYRIFVEKMRTNATTRACIFATAHVPATLLLMEMLEKSGLITYVGKVSMDRNAPAPLCEESPAVAAAAVEKWLKTSLKKYKNTKPMLTPRFIPSCTDDLLTSLGRFQKKYHVPVQSHLSENLSEIAWVRELCPYSSDYGEAYEHFGLFGGNAPTVMAHGVWPGKREFARIKERGVYIAHCPQSNTNIASGIAPVRQYLDAGIHIGLGSDVAGGSSDSIFRAMVDAIQVSKLRWRLITQDDAPITLDEAFYMATAGGGEFFGKVGKFEEGYEFDAVVLDDENLPAPREFSTHERLERIVYLGDDRNIAAKFVAGRKLFG
ncbi:amidohydrolase family protein [Hominifimenecus microfluidus]|uniref:Amidohydrolase family protein n=1 Tax=Hominifimenecus microfluidus TaxID=2885348 RepID=A0AAE3E8Y0_9FIRM|nr:amidohydrolase family protein [Hominifimenecus microfluidus]MCC2230702.1 amidohydrolase family protein [Hominifimenecus microfluidus]